MEVFEPPTYGDHVGVDDDDDNAVNDDSHVEEEGSSAGCLVFTVGPLIEAHYQRISY